MGNDGIIPSSLQCTSIHHLSSPRSEMNAKRNIKELWNSSNYDTRNIYLPYTPLREIFFCRSDYSIRIRIRNLKCYIFKSFPPFCNWFWKSQHLPLHTDHLNMWPFVGHGSHRIHHGSDPCVLLGYFCSQTWFCQLFSISKHT